MASIGRLGCQTIDIQRARNYKQHTGGCIWQRWYFLIGCFQALSTRVVIFELIASRPWAHALVFFKWQIPGLEQTRVGIYTRLPTPGSFPGSSQLSPHFLWSTFHVGSTFHFCTLAHTRWSFWIGLIQTTRCVGICNVDIFEFSGLRSKYAINT